MAAADLEKSSEAVGWVSKQTEAFTVTASDGNFSKKHLDRKKILCYNAKCSIMEGVAIDGTRKGFRLL